MRDIMLEYTILVDFLSKIMPKNCEIALQDVRENMNCITAIANGEISGRKIGSPLTDLAMKFIAEETWKEKDFCLNYAGSTKNKKQLRSSTYFIKDNGILLGMLCINVDDSKYLELSNNILSLGGLSPDNSSSLVSKEDKYLEIESFFEDIDDITNIVISEYFSGGTELPMKRLTQSEKIDIVKRLNDRGLFMVKGAVNKIAKRLCISDASLYRYLSKIDR